MPQVNPYLKPQKSPGVFSGGRESGFPDSGEAASGGPIVKPPVAGFWRRLGSLALDVVLCYAVLRALSWAAGDALLSLGRLANPIATTLALAYFVLGNGPVGKGRTVGKFLAGIRVTDLEGNAPGLGQSLVRAVVLFPGFLFSNIVAPLTLDSGNWNHMMLLMFAAIFPTMALFIGISLAISFNPFKQGIHDYLAKTLVRPAAAPRLNWEEICSIVGPNWRRFHRQPMINGMATFLLILALESVVWGMPMLKDGDSRRTFETATAVTRAHFSGPVSVYSRGLESPDADLEHPEAIPKEVVTDFNAQLMDRASTATMGVAVVVAMNGKWDLSAEELDAKIESFIYDYHERVSRERMAEWDKMADEADKEVESSGKKSADRPRNLQYRPIIYKVSLEESLDMLWPSIHVNKLKRYEFSLPPLKDGSMESGQESVPAGVSTGERPAADRVSGS